MNASKIEMVKEILIEATAELERATEKFPKPEHTTIALMEEVGELAQALLHLKEKADNTLTTQMNLRENVYKEGTQVIAMVLRILTEGDQSIRHKGSYCSYAGCKQKHIGGPCALCYE